MPPVPEKAKGRGRGRKRKASSKPLEKEESSGPPQQTDSPAQSQRYVPRFVSKRPRLTRHEGQGRNVVPEEEERTGPTAAVEKQVIQGESGIGHGGSEETQAELAVHDQRSGTETGRMEACPVKEPCSDCNGRETEGPALGDRSESIPGLALSCSQPAMETASHNLTPPQQRLPEGESETVRTIGTDGKAPGNMDASELDRDAVLLGMDAGRDAEGGCGVEKQQSVVARCDRLGYDDGDDLLMSPTGDRRNMELIDLLREDSENDAVEEEERRVSENVGTSPSTLHASLLEESHVLSPKQGGDPIVPARSPTHTLNDSSPHSHANWEGISALIEDNSHLVPGHTSPCSDATLLGSQNHAHYPYQETEAPTEAFYDDDNGEDKLAQTDSGSSKDIPESVTAPLLEEKTLNILLTKEGAVDAEDSNTGLSTAHLLAADPDDNLIGPQSSSDSLHSIPPTSVPGVQLAEGRHHCNNEELLDLSLTAINQIESQLPTDEALVPSCSPSVELQTQERNSARFAGQDPPRPSLVSTSTHPESMDDGLTSASSPCGYSDTLGNSNHADTNEGTCIVRGLIEELSTLNQFILSFRREIEAARKERNRWVKAHTGRRAR